MNLTAVSLFAGIGGFDLALERNGVKVVAAVEIDAKARGVLARHFPHTQLFNDVCEVTGDELRNAGFIPERGIITGGFPCQDLSVAGHRAGLGGSRSGLFWEIMRLVEDLQPRWVILENVPGLLSSKSGADMATVIGALAELGYGYAYRVLDAQHFGVPQRRRRVFIVAGKHSGTADSIGPCEILLEPQGSTGDSSTGNQTRQDIAGTVDAGAASDPRIGDGGGAQFATPRVSSSHANGGLNDHHGHGQTLRPRNRIVGGDVVGTLAAGAHASGFNGQDAYQNKLVVIDALVHESETSKEHGRFRDMEAGGGCHQH